MLFAHAFFFKTVFWVLFLWSHARRNGGVTTDEAPDEAEGNGDENAGLTFAFAFSTCRSASRGPNTTSLF